MTKAEIDVCLNCPKEICRPAGCMRFESARANAGTPIETNGAGEELYIYQGEKLTLAELARRYGMDPDVLYQRVKRHGWRISKALNTPVRPKRRKCTMTVGGEPVSMLEIAMRLNVAMSTVGYRVKQGWTGDQIVEYYGGRK